MRFFSDVCILWTFWGALVLWSVSATQAAEIQVSPFASVRTEYNDNILFERQSPLSDALTRLGAGVDWEASTERMKLEAFTFLELERYRDGIEQDTENWRLEIDGLYLVTPRLRISGKLLYTKDTTLESEIEEIGAPRSRDDRNRYRGQAGFFYRYTMRTNIAGGYSFYRSEYESDRNVDVDDHLFSVFLIHRFNESRDSISFGGMYSRSLSETRNRDSFSMNIGWRHRFAETFQFRGNLGVRYTIKDFASPRREDEDSSGGIVDVSLLRRGETLDARLGFRRDLRISSAGEDLVVDNLYTGMNYRFAPRWVLGMEGNLFFTKEDGDVELENSRFFEFASSLSYLLTKEHEIQIGYSYAIYKDRELDDNQVAERNRVWLTFQFRFPHRF